MTTSQEPSRDGGDPSPAPGTVSRLLDWARTADTPLSDFAVHRPKEHGGS